MTNKKEKIKLIVLFLGIVILMVVFWLVLRFFENGTTTTMADSFLENVENDGFATEVPKIAQGTITLQKKKYSYYDEIESYLFIGTDASGAEDSEDYQGSMADFLMLVVLDKTDNTYGFLQLNRDTMTKVTLLQDDGSGYAHATLQLCTAHWYGKDKEASCENTVDAVENLLGGIKIDGYYAINMAEIPTLNHAVGGVEVTLEEDFTAKDAKMKKGATITLNDEQSYLYIHDRYGVGDEENTSRMKRQKQYMKAFFQKAKEKAENNPAFLSKTLKELEDDATTDMTGKTMSRLAKAVSEGTSKGILSFDGEVKLGQALKDGIDHSEFYPDADSMLGILTSLYSLEE
jgi:LCP family protein required for cell wall assembly